MKNVINLTYSFVLTLLILCLPALVLASGTGKTDIKAMNASNVLDTTGKTVQLGNTWQEKPVVLVFIRHFG
jgi:hypothetical protein